MTDPRQQRRAFLKTTVATGLAGLSGSALIEAGKAVGLRTASEVFADRTYQDDGLLTPRSQMNALIENLEQAIAQALQIVQNQSVLSVNGKSVSLVAETICLHGDGTHALEFAVAIVAAFQKNGIQMKAP